jgi:cell division protein FtsL
MIRLNFVLAFILLLLSFALVESRYKSRHLFTQLDIAQQSARQLDVEFNQLEIEQNRLVNASQVSRIAARDLKMQKISPPTTLYVNVGDKTVAMSQEAFSVALPAAKSSQVAR